MEHENLISDSEYITLDHQTDVNKTHIKTESLKQELQQLHQTKQDTLVAGEGITIQDNVISATGGGATSTFRLFDGGGEFLAIKHVLTSEYKKLTTFSLECYNAAEIVLTGELKEELKKFVPSCSVSNGAITITNDGTNMKLINSAPSETVSQQATFTFFGGGGPTPS